MDDETLALLRHQAAHEAGLPNELGRWLAGETINTLRSDARRLAQQLGRGPARDAGGRFATHDDVNTALRRAAGYVPSPPTDPAEVPTGDLGIGKGAGARERARPEPDMNALIRGVVGGRRTIAYELAEQIATEEWK